MALDCSKCIKKNSVSSTMGHCSEFRDMPQVEACAKMDLGPNHNAKIQVTNELPTGSYIWLGQSENERPTIGH